MKTKSNENKVIYPELSYKIIGAAFKIYNALGWGHREKIYQRALATALEEIGLKFEREKYIKLKYNDKIIGTEFLDFIVENKVVVELKVMPQLGYIHINQVLSYLKSSGLKLAILIYFLKSGVRYRRIINAEIR